MEITIDTLAMRPAACLAAGVLLCSLLAPAHARQPAPAHPAGTCTAPAKPCRPANTRGTPAWPQAKAKAECARLRTAIVESEHAERLRAAMIESVQHDLSVLRKRYRKLGC